MLTEVVRILVLAWLGGLSMSSPPPPGPGAASPPPRAPGVRISDQKLTDTRLGELIAAGTFHSDIVEVELPANQITGAGVAALLDSPIERLQVLDLYFNPIGDAGARAIAASPKVKGVNRLRVSYGGLSLDGLRALVGPDSVLVGPTQLDVSGNPVGDAGVEAILESRLAPHLRELGLRETGLTDTGARALAGAEVLSGLERLTIGRNALTDAGRKALRESPHLRHTRIDHR